jgi:hypothetical protein
VQERSPQLTSVISELETVSASLISQEQSALTMSSGTGADCATAPDYTAQCCSTLSSAQLFNVDAAANINSDGIVSNRSRYSDLSGATSICSETLGGLVEIVQSLAQRNRGASEDVATNNFVIVCIGLILVPAGLLVLRLVHMMMKLWYFFCHPCVQVP